MHDVGDAVGVVGQRFGVFRQVNVRDGLFFAAWNRLDGLLCFQIDHSHHAATVTDCGIVSGDGERFEIDGIIRRLGLNRAYSFAGFSAVHVKGCLLYTSDAADE